MAQFLTTKGTSYYLEEIIRKAENELVLISPYLQISKTLLERLKDADQQKVKIILVYGKDELKPDEKEKLQALKNLSLHFLKDLHAKCFYNEKSMVITSMNMYEFSENTNREMGVLIQSDEKVYTDAVQEAKSILNSINRDSQIRNVNSQVVKEPKPPIYSATKEKPSKSVLGEVIKEAKSIIDSAINPTGYCIRCRKSIPLDEAQPLCHECWEKWNVHKNPMYKEKYCHTCGKGASTSMAKPECSACYNS